MAARVLPKPKGGQNAFPYRRTLDHLKAWRLSLPPKIKKATISYNPTTDNHTGMKLFTYQHVPQLKYNNPDVLFSIVDTIKVTQCTLKLTTKKGQRFIINGENTESVEIKRKLTEKLKEITE
ncbi:PREDICTED: uncharacterized protein LOC100641109 [Amphimedon queenslandica]|uniref:Ribosomal protein/NADH dehydrogenase domain-containing protein n=1 Tax=Amphimedon queenslandica TaxID=400682 RepID=A0A1X7VRW7_AMPQE|nr:PREDICTED: uncharacterized protein LOC100641109 [Amphimedon queenslandica]|eukprot:XP_003382975.1 PREDICTED: uncharacterized protein LOC100641109 [Amphimedon queenslandica]